MPKSKFKNINPTRVKTILLSIVIAVVLTGFVIYLIQAIYPSPKYEDYCNINVPMPIEKGIINTTEAECEANNGTFQNGYCDYYEKCNKEYQKVQDKYNLVVFIVAIIIGLLAVSAGIILSLPSVSSGLMIGGTFLTIYGTAVYWYNLSNWIRVIVLGAVLAILIWLGYKKLKN